jgi:hypothetical protein
MTKNELPSVIICECSSTEHQMILYPDIEERTIYCHVHLFKYGFFRRLKAAFKYLFGYKSRFGAWDEFIIKREYADKLREMADILDGKIK